MLKSVNIFENVQFCSFFYTINVILKETIWYRQIITGYVRTYLALLEIIWKVKNYLAMLESI